ncbi:MAG: hypothetical protein PVJ40_03505 [Gammaproteobacteria bacterium]|jgi:hypothetical protein
MNVSLKTRLAAMGAILMLLIPVVGAAAERGFEPGGYDFALAFRRDKLDIDVGGTRTANSINTVTLDFLELANPWFQPGFRVGYATLDRSGTSIPATLDPAGAFFGLSFRGRYPGTGAFSAQLRAAYTYYQVDDNFNLQSTNLTWYETRAELGVSYSQRFFDAGAGVEFLNLDGRQKVRDNGVFSSTSFDNPARTEPYLELGFHPDATGRIAVRLSDGDRRALTITFSRSTD